MDDILDEYRFVLSRLVFCIFFAFFFVDYKSFSIKAKCKIIPFSLEKIDLYALKLMKAEVQAQTILPAVYCSSRARLEASGFFELKRK